MTRPDDAARTAVIHAEIIGKKSLGKDYAKYSQSTAITSSNVYSGRIVGINDLFVVQKISPMHTVRHLRQDLPRVPRIGRKPPHRLLRRCLQGRSQSLPRSQARA